MTTLRIHFEVEEKHVGKCLVALEGMGKNLNFEIVAQVPFDRNAPGKAKSSKSGLKADMIANKLKLGPMKYEDILLWAKESGYHGAGVVSSLRSLVSRKRAKKSGDTYTLVEGK